MTKEVARKTKSTERPSRRKSGESTSVPAEQRGRQGAVSREEIAQRAYLLFLERGGEHGHDVTDWLRAEEELVSTAPGNGRRE